MTANVQDVAAYIVEQSGRMTTMKLQKLAYYSQAWHLVWEGEPLFDAEIQAWMNGPVVRDLYDKHRGRFEVSDWLTPKRAADPRTDSGSFNRNRRHPLPRSTRTPD